MVLPSSPSLVMSRPVGQPIGPVVRVARVAGVVLAVLLQWNVYFLHPKAAKTKGVPLLYIFGQVDVLR
jgi:hypothetical protein